MNESAEYTRLRGELRDAEIELKEQRERVAGLRRQLPLDTVAEDTVFQEPTASGELRDVRLSALFDDPSKTLVLMHFMHGKKQESPCPMCTLWADGYDGVVPHLRQRVNFALVVAGDPREIAEYGQGRGWRNLRFVSSGDTAFKQELGMEMPDGSQLPGVSVYRLAEDGSVRHFYTGCAIMGDGHYRGMDLLSPFWNFLDLTPEGREDFMPRVDYE